MTFLDARRLDDGTTLEADLCIVGAGAAGITIAREFIGQPWRVLLLESGGRRFAHRPQFLYIGENVGTETYPTTHSRFRMFGGSTTRWGGQCRPLDPIDFEARPWVPYSGWPFDRAHLEPWYRRACEVAHLGSCCFEPEALACGEPPPLPVQSPELATPIYRFSHPRDFGRAYADEIEAAPNVRVLLQANVVEIETDETARTTTGLQVATLNGRRLRVTAGAYVLACGGLENPRLLLASNRTASAGLGNGHDLVGRFFMDHAYFLTGHLVPAGARYDRSLHVIEGYEGVGWQQAVHTAFALSDEVLRAERLPAAAAYLVRRPSYKTLPAYFSPGGRSLAHLIEILTHATVPDRRFGRHLGRIARGFRDVRTTLMRQAIERVRPRPCLALRSVIETTPRPDSRVSLGAPRDRFGMPRIRVDWRLDPGDLRGLQRLRATLGRELERGGIGRLVDDESTRDDGWPASMRGGKHHIGTTRMHADPRRGVVDPSCRVHGMSNLYVAGSSVFPTSGYANPTLTIVALALRLADHLKAELRGQRSG